MYKFAVYAEGLLTSGVKQREYVPSREELKKLLFLKDMPASISCYGRWNTREYRRNFIIRAGAALKPLTTLHFGNNR